MNADNIKIVDSTPQDVLGIRNVQKITWIDTYPSKELGITKKDIESQFNKDNTVQGRKQIEKWKKRYSDKNEHRWVARDTNQIVGFCVAGKERHRNRIYAIYVLPDFQGMGLGRELLQKALNWLGGAKDIYINVASYNTKTINFYEKFGFVKTGRIVHSRGVEPLSSGKIIPEIEMVKRTAQLRQKQLINSQPGRLSSLATSC